MDLAAAFLLLFCSSYLGPGQALECREAPRLANVEQIDAGVGQVVAVDTSKQAYHLSGSNWYRLGTKAIKHVTVGPAGIWGTDPGNTVQKFVAGDFVPVPGAHLWHVDAGGDGTVVGLTPSGNMSRSYPYAHCLRDFAALAFHGQGSVALTGLSQAMYYISCGPKFGCWGLDYRRTIRMTTNVTPNTCRTNGWTSVSGPPLKMIEVGSDGKVFGLGTNGKVYERTGITDAQRQGRTWTEVSVCMSVSHLTYDLNQLWVVTSNNWLLQCTL